MLIDTHSHIADAEFSKDQEAVIKRALEADVQKMIVIGTGLDSSRRAIALAEKYPFLYATVGLHPHDAKECNDALLDQFDQLTNHPKVVGIGEAGYDFYYNHSTIEAQRHAFTEQIRLAKKKELPLVIHTRDAWEETFRLFDAENIREHAENIGVVLHCFTGDKEIALQGTRMGLYISFSGIMTFKNAKAIQEAASTVDLDKIVVETDAPYLAPQGFRGKRNEPAYVTTVAEKLADLRNLPYDTIARMTTENAERLFHLPAA